MELRTSLSRCALVALALLLALPAASSLAGEGAPTTAVGDADGTATGREVAPASASLDPAPIEAEPVWLTSLPQALEAAKKRHAFILVDLYAEWCGWCKQLEKKVFASPEFLAKARSFVLLRVDTEDGGDGSRLQALHEASSLPNTLILDAKGVRVGQISGYAPTREFLAYIDQQLDAWKSLRNHYSGLLASSDTDIQLKVAKELHKRQDGERAAGLYEKVAATIDPGSSSYAWIQYMLADSYRLDRRFELAEKTIEKARALAARADEPSVFGEQLDLLHYYIAQDNGDCRGARTSLERFLAEHPQSELRPRLQRTLSELQHDSKCT